MANALGAFISAEVARAESDYQAMRARGLSIVGVTGGIIALVSGFLVVASGSRQDVLPSDARWTLLVALCAFVAAAICALLINLPVSVTASDEMALAGFVKNNWNDEGWDKQAASLLADYLISLRAANKRASRLLTASISFEVVGISIVSLMTLLIVNSLPAA